jgi:hypothetical protein
VQTVTTTPQLTDLVYRFEGRLGELYPLGVFEDGLRFHNQFEGHIVDGPFAGGRIFGLDQFTLRPDGVGVIEAPEVIEADGHRVSVHVRGYVVPPAGAPAPPLELVAQPGFAFPDVPFRVTATGLVRTVSPAFTHLNHTVLVVEGEVNMATGRLEVEARAVTAG